MIETNALLGGEESGGFAVRGHIPERDGILIGLLFADMMVKSGKPISQILAGLEERVGPHAYARHEIQLVRETYETDRKRILETLEKNEPQEVAGVPAQRVRSGEGVKLFLADGTCALPVCGWPPARAQEPPDALLNRADTHAAPERVKEHEFFALNV